MSAPRDLATWMATHEHKDKKLPHIYKYHSRSDIHSVQLCEFLVRDLLMSCKALREHATQGRAAYGINVKHAWPTTGKVKALDLAVGVPAANVRILSTGAIQRVGTPRLTNAPFLPENNAFERLLIACEAKAVMTEHGKSQPRLFDELSSSHEIVHQGDQDTIAAGIVMVNIAAKFASPLRQKHKKLLHWSIHDQPMVAKRMIGHLRGLRIRDDVGQVGFDAFCTFVVDCDNQTGCELYPDSPAPQLGDADYYDTFIERIKHFYTMRFGEQGR